MTLRDFIAYLSENPQSITLFFLALPLAALVLGWISADEGDQSPWNYVYATLIYLVCIPGIFSVALSVYFFMFERGSIMNTNILTQVLPIVSMALTLGIIKRNVSFAHIPGFDRISSFVMVISAVMMLMYLLDRTKIITFVIIPVQYLLLLVAGLVLVIRYGFKKVFA